MSFRLLYSHTYSHTFTYHIPVVASLGSGYIVRNPDAFAANYNYGNEGTALDDNKARGTANPKPAPYTLYKPAPANEDMSNVLYTHLVKELGETVVAKGMNVTAESFYSSQGRIDEAFDDDNTKIIQTILKTYPEAKTLEMESFQLLHLAQCSRVPIYASAAAIVVANRSTAKVIDGALLEMLEQRGNIQVVLYTYI